MLSGNMQYTAEIECIVILVSTQKNMPTKKKHGKIRKEYNNKEDKLG
jgi:hypothetical protein